MRITDPNPSGINGLSPGGVKPGPDAGAYGRGGNSVYGQSADQVQLSGASRLATSVLADHSARMAQLRSLVAGGQYDPSAEAVGRAVVKEAVARAHSRETHGD